MVVRTPAGAVDEESLAALEYAAQSLGVRTFVTLGHSSCRTLHLAHGAPLGEGAIATESMRQLAETLEPALQPARRQGLAQAELLAAAGERQARRSAAESLRRSAVLRRLQAAGTIVLQPAMLAQDGRVQWLEPLPAPAADPATVAAHALPPALPPHVAMQMLQAAHRRSLDAGAPRGDHRPQATQADAAAPPLAAVLCCTDGRAAPAHHFDLSRGELAVLTTPAGVVTEFALAHLEGLALTAGTSLVVVLAHRDCRELLAAAVASTSESDAQRTLRARLAPTVAKARHEGAAADRIEHALAKAQALLAAAELQQRSAALSRLLAQGRLVVQPAVLDPRTGDIEWLTAPPLPAAHAAPLAESEAVRGATPPSHDPADAHGGEHAGGHAGAHGGDHAGEHAGGHAGAHGGDHAGEHAGGHAGAHGGDHAGEHVGAHASSHGNAHGHDLSWATESPLHEMPPAPAHEAHAKAHAHGEANPAHEPHHEHDPHDEHDKHAAGASNGGGAMAALGLCGALALAASLLLSRRAAKAA